MGGGGPALFHPRFVLSVAAPGRASRPLNDSVAGRAFGRQVTPTPSLGGGFGSHWAAGPLGPCPLNLLGCRPRPTSACVGESHWVVSEVWAAAHPLLQSLPLSPTDNKSFPPWAVSGESPWALCVVCLAAPPRPLVGVAR